MTHRTAPADGQGKNQGLGEAQAHHPGQGQGQPAPPALAGPEAFRQPQHQDGKEGVAAVLLQFLGVIDHDRGEGHRRQGQQGGGNFHQHAAEAPDEPEGPDPEQPGEPPEHHFTVAPELHHGPDGEEIEGRGGLARGQGLFGRGLHGRQGHPGLIGPEVAAPQFIEAEIDRHPKDQRHGQAGKVWPG